jgi:hypothetical protein
MNRLFKGGKLAQSHPALPEDSSLLLQIEPTRNCRYSRGVFRLKR